MAGEENEGEREDSGNEKTNAVREKGRRKERMEKGDECKGEGKEEKDGGGPLAQSSPSI